jgi:hypothetical protein
MPRPDHQCLEGIHISRHHSTACSGPHARMQPVTVRCLRADDTHSFVLCAGACCVRDHLSAQSSPAPKPMRAGRRLPARAYMYPVPSQLAGCLCAEQKVDAALLSIGVGGRVGDAGLVMGPVCVPPSTQSKLDDTCMRFHVCRMHVRSCMNA